MSHIAVSAGVAFAALFAIVDPVGNIATFLPLAQGKEQSWQRRQAFKAAVTATVILSVFLLVGHNVLVFFDVSLAAVEVVGGLVIGYTGWQMTMQPRRADADEAGTDEDIWFHPVAFPMLAGPGALAVVLGLSNRHDSWLDFLGFIVGIGAICLVAFVIMWFAGPISKRVGPSGLEIIERVMGLLVLAIAAELVFHGIEDHFGIVVNAT